MATPRSTHMLFLNNLDARFLVSINPAGVYLSEIINHAAMHAWMVMSDGRGMGARSAVAETSQGRLESG